MTDGEQFRPGGPAHESGQYAAQTPDGRTLGVWFVPAGAALPQVREPDARFMLVGLPHAVSH